MAPWARGRGVAAQATRALCEWAIRDHGFERVQLFAATGNAASQRVAEKAGFVREGVARNACCVPDGRADMVLFSLVPQDLQTSGTASTSQAVGSHLEDSTGMASSSERSASPGHDLALVGIGADGWSGLTPPARTRIEMAGVVIGGQRQLDLLPDTIAAQRVPWPSRFGPSLPSWSPVYRSRGLVVLASGDPMFFGIGRALVEEVGPQSLLVLPHPSSISLACARLGWPVEDIDVVSLVGRPLASLTTSLHQRRRLMILSSDAGTPAQVAKLLTDKGFGGSTMTVLEQLGAPGEARRSGVAQTWDAAPGDPLNVVAVECLLSREGTRLGLAAGLADAVYEDDGQLTKREVRAVTLFPWHLRRESCSGTSVGERAASRSSGCGRTGPAAPSRSRATTNAPLASVAMPRLWAFPACGS